ncbi:hypothetical protein ACJIZ3_015340 [Penstemon smallii]|uniref:Snakin-2 n=1 Tax=Penstemon smallii TaxID=265156 RepID=A0ABD3RPH5_9LAMI
MAIPKVIVATIILSLLVLHHQVQAIQTNQVTSNAASKTAYTPRMDCGGACAARCKLSSRPKLCKRSCGTCCARCNCVPSGTYGNYHECLCYARLTTRNNKPKCP